MLHSAALMAFAATTQPEKARAFYEGTLGLRVISEDDFALALDANGTHLRIQKVSELTPAPFTALGFRVDDIATVVDGLRARGVRFQTFPGMAQDERGIWQAPSNARVAWFRDPDGNTLSLTQF
jgi:catechol 2,3-dioxygenase-like lactoylglutathione lyase family enzyme